MSKEYYTANHLLHTCICTTCIVLGASLEEQLEILKRELENTNETLTETNEEFESIRQESHDHQVTIEEMEEEFRQTKKELEVCKVQ